MKKKSVQKLIKIVEKIIINLILMGVTFFASFGFYFGAVSFVTLYGDYKLPYILASLFGYWLGISLFLGFAYFCLKAILKNKKNFIRGK